MNKYFSILLFLVSTYFASAQSNKIQLLGKVKEQKSFLLRWVPSNEKVWLESMKYGYTLTKITYPKGKNTSIKKIIFSGKKPESKGFWEDLAKKDDYAKVANKLLFDSEPTSKDTSEINNENRARFAFLMIAADFSALVSEHLGLRFEDVEVNKNDRYKYIISINYPDLNLTKKYEESLIMYVDKLIPDYNPKDLEIKDYADSTVILSWRTHPNAIYTAFNIERSDDGGKTYNKVNNAPIIPTDGKGDSLSYGDKVPELYKDFYYRVKGLTPFADESPASETSKIFAYNTRIPGGQNLNYQFTKNRKTMLTWSYPDSLLINIEGFKVRRSDNLANNTEIITPKLLPKNRRFFADSIIVSKIYQVIAVDLRGNEKVSQPLMVEVLDSIPPIGPKNIKAIVDKKGIVKITWNPNQEEDLFGYHVFRGNESKTKMFIRTKAPIQTTMVLDTIPLYNLKKEVFYTVVALDNHLNISIGNDTIIVKRPDVIPPDPPIFTSNYTVSDSLITLHWIKSQSPDVIVHKLYKVTAPDTIKVLLLTLDSLSNQNTFKDSIVNEGGKYKYVLEAIDDSGLSSNEQCFRNLEVPIPRFHIAIKEFISDFDKETFSLKLSWKYNYKKTPTYFVLYRRTGTDGLSFYKKIRNANLFIESKLKEKIEYGYKIIAVFEDESESIPSKELVVKVPTDKRNK
jgi:uncharacterized protein